MKGLIYRELYLARKTYIFGLLSYFVFLLFGVLTRLSILYGNLARLDEESFRSINSASYWIFTLLPAVLIFFTLMGEGGVIVSDYQAKWNTFACTFPVSEKKQAAIKYGIKAVALVLSLIFSVINAAVISTLCDKDFDLGMLKYILMIMTAAVLVSCASTPMLIKYKSSNAVAGRIMGAAVVLSTAAVFYIKKLAADYAGSHSGMEEDELTALMTDKILALAEKIRDIFFIAMPFLLAAAFVLGYFFTVKLLKRREK